MYRTTWISSANLREKKVKCEDIEEVTTQVSQPLYDVLSIVHRKSFVLHGAINSGRRLQNAKRLVYVTNSSQTQSEKQQRDQEEWCAVAGRCAGRKPPMA